MKKCFKNIILLFFFFSYSIFCLADRLIIEPDEGRAPILTAIAHSKSSLDLALYGLTDTNLIQALIQAKKRGKLVRILLEPQPYQAIHENTPAIQFLQNAHIALHWPNPKFKFLHQKTFLFDNTSALVMTFNLTHSSFKNERNFALFITHPDQIKEIQEVFDADWKQQQAKVKNPNLVWSPNNSRKKIVDFIQQARSEIKIYAQNISDPQIIEALAKAAQAKVKVEVLISSPPTKNCLHYLTQAGVIIHISHGYLIHAKVILVDEKKAVLGSINLTRTSLDDNRELSVITDDKKIVHTLLDTFKQDSMALVGFMQ
ncbi:MAG: clsA [Gammaproteobacteria bacterium]|nr:clsA [Gammaproteobacteria bacterium]